MNEVVGKITLMSTLMRLQKLFPIDRFEHNNLYHDKYAPIYVSTSSSSTEDEKRYAVYIFIVIRIRWHWKWQGYIL